MFPQARDVLAHVKARGGLVGLASSNEKNVIEYLLQQFDLATLVDAYVSLDDVNRGKPDPEMLYRVTERMDLDPSDTVMTGDTPYDIQAGQRAGCSATVGVATGSFSKTQLATHHPSLILDRIGDFIKLL
jgi:pyrophosphatase PpaX